MYMMFQRNLHIKSHNNSFVKYLWQSQPDEPIDEVKA